MVYLRQERYNMQHSRRFLVSVIEVLNTGMQASRYSQYRYKCEFCTSPGAENDLGTSCVGCSGMISEKCDSLIGKHVVSVSPGIELPNTLLRILSISVESVTIWLLVWSYFL